MDQLNRLFDAGIDAVGMYAQATGRSSADVQNDLSYGRISAEEFIDVVSNAMETGAGGVQKIAGAAKEAGTSWQGTMDNMKAACTRGVLGIINAIDDGLKSIDLPTLREMIAGFGSFLESTLGKTGNVIKGLFQEWGAYIRPILSYFKAAFSQIPNAIAPAISAIKDFIGEILKSLSSGALKEDVQALCGTFISLGSVLSKLVKTALPVFSKALKLIGGNLTWIIPLVTAAVAGFKAWSILQTAAKRIQTMTKAISAATAAAKAATAATKLQIIGIGSVTVATTGEAAATPASTAAISLKQVAVGVLTRKIKLVTAAQWLWNAAMNAMSANPIGVLITAVAALTVGFGLLSAAASGSYYVITDAFQAAGEAASHFCSGIESAKSHLSEFNATLFASSEEQQALSDNMEEVQSGITGICKRASDERRGYTAEEIQKLDEYFEKLRELYAKELEIEQSKTQAIQQQALTQAETHNGSLAEYQTTAQEWIKTAREQADAETDLIETQTTNQIALLNQRYGDQADLSNAAYANEYNAIIENQQAQLDQINQGVGKVVAAYANGYAQRANLAGLEKQQTGADNASLESEQQRHSDRIFEIQYDSSLTDMKRMELIQYENTKHKNKMAAIWEALTENMSEEERNQLGVYMGMAAEAELYGGELEDETEDTVKAIIDTFDELPKGTREAMANAMSPMLDEMEKEEPKLYTKASSIGQGIIASLKRALQEHSPSKATRKLAKYFWMGYEEETDQYEPRLYHQADEVGRSLVEAFEAPLSGKKPQNPVHKLLSSMTVGSLPFSLLPKIDFSRWNPDNLMSQMQEAVAASHANVTSNVCAATYANVISKFDTSAFTNRVADACREGCEAAQFQADVSGKVILRDRIVGALVAPYVSEELAKGGVYE